MRLAGKARSSKSLASLAAAIALLGAGVANASSASAAPKKSGGTLVVAALMGFTGADAAYGPEGLAGCVPAVDLINKAGGVLGHKLTCQPVDTASDPADAVPAAHRMLSQLGNRLLFVFGTGGNSSSAVVPIINAAHVPIFPSSGQSLFNRNHYPYFWRTVPIDAAQGFAMALATQQLGKRYQRVAGIWSDDTSAMGSEPNFVKGMKLLHHSVVDNVILPLNQASYSSEVVKLLQTKPQLIVGEIAPTTAPALFTEIEQLNGGKMIPALGDAAFGEAVWQKAVSGAIGRSVMDKYATLVLPTSPLTTPGFKTFVKGLKASNVSTKGAYSTDAYSASYYDDVNIVALAALKAKSADPSVVNRHIAEIADGTSGAIVVHTFAKGKKLISQGKNVRYVGASGPIVFPRYHNWEPPYVLAHLARNGSEKIVAHITEKLVEKLLSKTVTAP